MNINLQDLLKRHFWAVGVLTLVACTFFAGRAVAHVIEAKALTDSTQPPAVTPQAKPVVAAPTDQRSKAGKPVADRNLFCSACAPAPVDTSANTAVAAGNGPPATQLPLQLVATFVSDNFRMATVQNTDTMAQGGYLMNGEIPDAGPIVAIQYKYVDFKNNKTGNGRVERISLLAEPPPPAPTAPPPTAVADTGNAGPTDEMTAELQSGIHKIDDSNFEVDRSLIDKLLANPLAATKGARVTASIKNGQPNGIKLYAIRPSSVYAMLGLANGDTIHAINGNDLDSLDKGLEVYQKVKDENSLQVDITRRGKDMSIHYTIK